MEHTPAFRHPRRCRADHQEDPSGETVTTLRLVDDVWYTSPAGTVNVRDVRRRVGDLLGPGHPRMHDAELLTSEIATNAITHTATAAPGGRLRLSVWTGAGRIRVEITDDGGSATRPHVRNDPEAEDGRGLYLVQALADGFGTAAGQRHDGVVRARHTPDRPLTRARNARPDR